MIDMVLISKPFATICTVALLFCVNAPHISGSVATISTFELADPNQRTNSDPIGMSFLKSLSGGTSSLSVFFSPLLLVCSYLGFMPLMVILDGSLSFALMFLILCASALYMLFSVFMVSDPPRFLTMLSAIPRSMFRAGANLAICTKPIALLFVGLKVFKSGGVFAHAAWATLEEAQLFHSASLSLYHVMLLASGVICRLSGSYSLANTEIVSRKAA